LPLLKFEPSQYSALNTEAVFNFAGNGLYTMLVTAVKDNKTSKHVSILCQL